MGELQHETAQNASLQQLMSYIKHGWPDCIRDVPPQLKNYYGFREELTTSHGVIVKGDELLAPPSLQAVYTSQCHKVHAGAEACKCRATDTLYWSNIVMTLRDM